MLLVSIPKKGTKDESLQGRRVAIALPLPKTLASVLDLGAPLVQEGIHPPTPGVQSGSDSKALQGRPWRSRARLHTFVAETAEQSEFHNG